MKRVNRVFKPLRIVACAGSRIGVSTAFWLSHKSLTALG